MKKGFTPSPIEKNIHKPLVRGVTLIEVMIAATLTCVIALSVTFVFIYGMHKTAETNDLSKATHRITIKLEQLRSTSFYALPSLNGASFDKEKGKVLVSPIGSDLVQLTVIYNWKKDKQPIQISTLRSVYP